MQTISDATGLPLATVVDADRRLVKGGLRTKGGRGFSVAQMAPLDAARLLTALLASTMTNASVEAVQRYIQTHADKSRSSEKLFAATGLADLAELPARHGFVDALEALIASAATGSLADLIADTKGRMMPHIEVFAFTRATRGRIRISGLPNGQTTSVEYIPSKKSGGLLKSSAETFGDLEQSRRITEQTIYSIAELLAEEAGHERT
jgi:hypothetical protein